MRVLVVEDDREMAEMVAIGLRHAGMAVDVAFDGPAGLERALIYDYDVVDGLGLGADDYLPKPFDFRVLVARIGALFRRAQPAIPPVLRCSDLVVDTARRCAWRAGKRLDLTPKEFGVLELLVAAQGRSVSAEERPRGPGHVLRDVVVSARHQRRSSQIGQARYADA